MKFSKNLLKFSQNLKKHRFAVISETVRDRAKRSQFWALSGILHAKLQILKFSVLLFSDWLI